MSTGQVNQNNQQQKILILTAIPHSLRLDKEIREIEDAIRRANKRDLFDIRKRTAVRSQDIRRALAEEKPQIVHFCGHGLEDGSLLLEDEAGQDKSVSPEGLASLFRLHANYVNCVLLNACHSDKTAAAISKYINYAIGMNQPIGDKAAIAFAQGFYDGLGYPIPDNQDVFQRAFEEGKVAIQLEISNSMETRKMTMVSARDEPDKIPEHSIPVLLKNPKLVSIVNDSEEELETPSLRNDAAAINEKEPPIESQKSSEAREDDEPQVPQLTNSMPATLSSFRQAKVKTLQKSLEVLSAKYEAAYQQLNYTLSEVDRISLRGQIESLEREIVQVESELSKLID